MKNTILSVAILMLSLALVFNIYSQDKKGAKKVNVKPKAEVSQDDSKEALKAQIKAEIMAELAKSQTPITDVKNDTPNTNCTKADPMDQKIMNTLRNLKLDFELTTEIHKFNNLDLQKVDETSHQSIYYTDDKGTFAYSSLDVDLSYMPIEGIKFNMDFVKSGLWGSDQFGNLNSFNGFLYFSALNFEWIILGKEKLKDSADTKMAGASVSNKDKEKTEVTSSKSNTYVKATDMLWKLTVGRQSFELGDAEHEYYLDDTLDAIVLDLDFGMPGRIKLIPFDFFGMGKKPENLYFMDYLGKDSTTIVGMNGDTNVIRFGGVYEQTEFFKKTLKSLLKGDDKLGFKAFAMYADIGAIGSGSDITYNGNLGNFADNDWTAMFGGRVFMTKALNDKNTLMLWIDTAYSMGKDRKQQPLQDVSTKGSAFGGGAKIDSTISPKFQFSLVGNGFYAQGGKYSQNGQQYNHGFTSFKGNHMGGNCLDEYAGSYPSAYIGSKGVYDSPNDIRRSGGSAFGHLGIGGTMTLEPQVHAVAAFFDFYTIFDTNKTNLNFDAVDAGVITAPYGMSTEQFYAQRRFGKKLGDEFDLKVAYTFKENLDFYVKCGMFIPGEFYKIEIERVAGTQLGGTEKFWMFAFGTQLRF